jgi:hypothetical protein
VRLDPFFFKPPDYRHGLLGCYLVWPGALFC